VEKPKESFSKSLDTISLLDSTKCMRSHHARKIVVAIFLISVAGVNKKVAGSA
jgi:hypothetical protein